MYDTPIKLVKETIEVDTYGDQTKTETDRTVYADVLSIRQSEFYQAAAVGMKPEIVFLLADYLEYEEEKKVKYRPRGAVQDRVYDVLRTYQKKETNELEVICKRGVDK